MLFKTKGMNQDLSVSAFNPEFSFENRNLRLSTNEGNTLMSWVNEKGTLEVKTISINVAPWKDEPDPTKDFEQTIKGIPLGTAVINHQLVVFTKEKTEISSKNEDEEPTYETKDRIYVLTYSKEGNAVEGSCLFCGNLNFDVKHPIECLVSYEAEEIQKVYWVDGLNQPRIINIKASNDKVEMWNTYDGLANFFDFNPAIVVKGNISIDRDNTAGTFAPGVIQYAFCYLNMYSQQSNIVDISPLYYISPSDSGASPEERVTCNFGITISTKELNTNYNYVRIFSIQRTSIDGVPIVKHLIDISTKEFSKEEGETQYTLYYKDTGIGGETMDSTALLYMTSKRPLSAETIASKDNTLFLGNITDLSEPATNIQDYFDNIRGKEGEAISMTFANGDMKEINLEDSTNTIYKNTFELQESQQTISTFKGGEIYRFGFQLKDKYGVWTNPIFIDDFTNNCYPQINKSNNLYSCKLVYSYAYIDLAKINTYVKTDIRKNYTEIRPVIVHPTEADRKVLCQGVLNPTVFQASNRKGSTTGVDSQASWFFRPMVDPSKEHYIDPDKYGNYAEFIHYKSLPWHEVKTKTDFPLPVKGYWDNAVSGGATYDEVDNDDLKIEIFGAEKLYTDAYDTTSTPDLTNVNTQFFVDQSIVTLNSPDIELREDFPQDLPEDIKLRIVGAVPITSNASYTYVETNNKESEITKELAEDYTHNNISECGGQRLLSDFLWQDSLILNRFYSASNLGTVLNGYGRGDSERVAYNRGEWPNKRENKFFVNPWHATRPLNNDWEQNRTMLQKKVMVTQLFSHFSEYFFDEDFFKSEDETSKKYLLNQTNYKDINAKLYNPINRNSIVLPEQSSSSSQKTYGGYIDTALLNNHEIRSLMDFCMPSGASEASGIPLTEFGDEDEIRDNNIKNFAAAQEWIWGGARGYNTVSMKYNSASHAVIAFNMGDDEEFKVPILPRLQTLEYSANSYFLQEGESTNYITFWGDQMKFRQPTVNRCRYFPDYAFLWIGELYREDSNNFGGKSLSALKANTWLIGGPSISIDEKTDSVTLNWTNGDTYFQRYDCLKTYPTTEEDINQNSEILSFMCETRVNLDGRYDKLRGVSRNILPLIDSTNINKINPVYSQKDNYFTSRVFQQEDITSQHYPNYICYSGIKEAGSDVDTYTDISLASVLELDGDKGEISALRKLNNHIFAFQDSGISRVMFNDNVQVQSTEGVPIQIANSGKVLGKDYISNTVGCSNKWSIVQTPNGLYFIDSNDKSIYLFNGQLDNISSKYGFNTWCKQHILATTENTKWDPVGFNNFVGHYDRQNQEVLYVNKEEALAWNEKLGSFTSFYDYGNSPFFENLDDVGIWIKPMEVKDEVQEGEPQTSHQESTLWRHQAGEYCKFFDKKKPYWMTLVGNPEPTIDKIFTNLEFRASVEGDGEQTNAGKFNFYLPFDSLETWNEYQHGLAKLGIKNGHAAMKHHTLDNEASLKRKFRIWRCDIPRDNAPLSDDAALGVSRTKQHPVDRMRNPWLYLKLQKDADTDKKVEIHDMMMTYFT